ncbi:MAG: ATP-binding protein [Acidobacteriota bacterium]
MSVSKNGVLSLVAFLLIGAAVYVVVDLNDVGRRRLVSEFNNYERLRVRQVAHEVEAYLQTSSANVLHLADVLVEIGPDSQRAFDEIQRFAAPLPGLPTGAVTLIDRTGRTLHATGAPTQGIDAIDTGVLAWAGNPDNRGKVLIVSGTGAPVSPEAQPASGRTFVATPYWVGSSGAGSDAKPRWSGVLALSLDLTTLLAMHQSLSSTPDQPMAFWIMSHDGTLLVQSEHPEMVFANVRRQSEGCFACHVSFNYVEQMLSERLGVATYRLRTGPERVSAFAPVSVGNAVWIVVASGSMNVVVRSLKVDMQWVAVVVGLLVVAFSLLSWSSYRSFRLRIKAEAMTRQSEEKQHLEEHLRAERLRADQELRRLNRQHALILDSVGDGIIGVDATGRHTFANPAALRMLGYRTDELLGEGSHSLWHHTRNDGQPHLEQDCQIAAAYRDGTVHQATDDVFWRKDRSSFAVDYTSTPILEGGSPSGAVVTFRDISEKRRLESQLRQAQKMEAIGTLAGGIAHDFNNILGAIVGNTELMMCDLATEHPAQESIGEILKATKRATDLVRQILTFSRQREQQRRTIELGLVAKEALKLLRATLPATITIQTDIVADEPPVLADPTQLYQVFMNLAANAAHAMRENGGRLTVRVAPVVIDAELVGRHPTLRPGPFVLLSVSDTGHGMDADTLDRVFDPFFTTKPLGEGTGLGLAVVHGIVTGHGGAILVRSEPGDGTTFDVYFPVAEIVFTEHASVAPVPRGQGQRLLYVDDEPALVMVFKRGLTAMGYQVETHTNPEEALERFASSPDSFDLVITDLAMPGLSGRELARRILDLRPDQAIVMVTGFSGTLTPERARQLRLRAVLHKPLDMADLGRAVHEALHPPS